MKSLLLIATSTVLFLCLLACKTTIPGGNENVTNDTIIGKTQNEVAGTTANDTVRIANDSLQYEVIIIDGGFNYWLASRAQPRGYYGESYLRTKNNFWTTEWNNRVLNPQRYGDMYQMRIDYSPEIDYGYEVNYLIYNYLVYFQITNNQKLGGIIPQY